MKIQGRKNQPVGSIGPFSAPIVDQAPQAEQAPAAGDRVELASSTQVRQLGEMANAMPSVRAEKVGGLRDAIEEGSYYVESDKLAKKVVDEVLTEALLARSQARDLR